MRLLDAAGEQVGIMSLAEAKSFAYDQGVDLVCIAPQATPPVCRAMDYGKYRYEQDKREKEQKKKQQTVEVKEVQLSCRIDKHDFDTKLNHAKRFLTDGNKVKITIVFSGREMNHTDRGYDLMASIKEELADIGGAEKAPSLDGRFMTLVISPKKADETK